MEPLSGEEQVALGAVLLTVASLAVTLGLAWRARLFLARAARAPGRVTRISMTRSEYDRARPAQSAEIEGLTVWRPAIYSGCLSVLLLLASVWFGAGEERRTALAQHRLTAPILGEIVLLLALRSVVRRVPRSAGRLTVFALCAGLVGVLLTGLSGENRKKA